MVPVSCQQSLEVYEVFSDTCEPGEVASRLTVLWLCDDSVRVDARQSCERAGDATADDPDLHGVVGLHCWSDPAFVAVTDEFGLTLGIHSSSAAEIEPERRGVL